MSRVVLSRVLFCFVFVCLFVVVGGGDVVVAVAFFGSRAVPVECVSREPSVTLTTHRDWLAETATYTRGLQSECVSVAVCTAYNGHVNPAS